MPSDLSWLVLISVEQETVGWAILQIIFIKQNEYYQLSLNHMTPGRLHILQSWERDFVEKAQSWNNWILNLVVFSAIIHQCRKERPIFVY